MKAAVIMMLGAAGLWLCGFLFAFLAKGHAGHWVNISYLCFFAGVLVGIIGAVILIYRFFKFVITKDPKALQ